MTRTSRTVTTAALALAVSAAAVAPAFAASSDTTLSTRSAANAAVVSLTINLPAALPAVPGVPKPLSLDLLSVEGGGLHDATGKTGDLARALSSLAGGTLVTQTPLSAVLDRSLLATQAKPGTQTANLLSVPANPLGLKLAAAPQSVTTTIGGALGSTSRSQVATSALGSLADLGAGAAVDALLGTLVTATQAVGTGAAPLTNALGGVTSMIPSVTVPNPLGPVVGGPATISTPATTPTTFTDLLSKDLPAQLAAIQAKLRDGAIITLNGLDAQQTVSGLRDSKLVTAAASSNLADLSLFGGLVTVTASKSSATATAGGAPGSGAADGSATLVKVTVGNALGDLLKALVSDKGITVGLLDGTALGKQLDATTKGLVSTVDAALNTALAQVVTLLETLNSSAKLIQQGTFTKTVSKDGRTAEAHATPAQVTLGLPTLPNLVQLSIGRSDAVVSAQAIAPAAPVVPNTPPAAPTALPRTGGSTTLAVVGLMTLLGAAAVRRRQILG